MVCDERGRDAMVGDRVYGEINMGKWYNTVQDSVSRALSVRAGSVPTVWIGSVERDCE